VNSDWVDGDFIVTVQAFAAAFVFAMLLAFGLRLQFANLHYSPRRIVAISPKRSDRPNRASA
jgi:hypothetical protein